MKHIVVLGAGITSSYVVSSLLDNPNYRITVLDARGVASGASQNTYSSYRIVHSCSKITELAFHALNSFRQIDKELADAIEKDDRGALYFFRKSDYSKFQDICVKYSQPDWSIELLDAYHGKKRFPVFNWQRDMMATYEPKAFAVNLSKFTKLRFEAIRSQNLTLIENCPAEGFLFRDNKVMGVKLRGETIKADHVVLATGAWTPGLLKSLGIESGVKTKQIQVNVSPGNDYAKELPIYFDSHSTGFGKGAPSGEHVFGYALPDWNDSVEYSLEPNKVQVEMAMELNKCLIPGLKHGSEVSTFRLQDGYYNGSKVDFFDPLNWQGLTVATGWGGTGFKVAPTIGQRVANHVMQILQNS